MGRALKYILKWCIVALLLVYIWVGVWLGLQRVLEYERRMYPSEKLTGTGRALLCVTRRLDGFLTFSCLLIVAICITAAIGESRGWKTSSLSVLVVGLAICVWVAIWGLLGLYPSYGY